MSRVKVLGALVLAVAMLVVPAGASLANPVVDCCGAVFLRGYVLNTDGSGAKDTQVEVWRVAHSTLAGKSVVKAENGEWGVALSPVPGEYIIRVVLLNPTDSVLDYCIGYGHQQVCQSMPVSSAPWDIPWSMSVAVADAAKALPGKCTPQKDDDLYVLNDQPVTFKTDVPGPGFPPAGPVYFWGRTFEGFAPNAQNAVPAGNATVEVLWKRVYFQWDYPPHIGPQPPIQTYQWVLKYGPKFSRTGDGLYGFGGTPVPGLYMVRAEKGALTGYTLFFVPEGQFGVSYGPINVFLN